MEKKKDNKNWVNFFMARDTGIEILKGNKTNKKLMMITLLTEINKSLVQRPA